MHKLVKDGLTFDDVLVVPVESDVLPEDVDLTTRLTNKITLNIPVMSAGMDTVTESRMAIALARQGGIGIIHRNMSIEKQASEVDKVKRSEHGVITDPFSLTPNHYVKEADELMARYHISGVPITENGKLVGIITNRDLRFETDHNKKIYEVMTKENLITAPEGTTLDTAKEILTVHKIEKLPIVDSDFMLKGLITIKDIEKSIKYPNAAKDDQGRLIVGAAVAITEDMYLRIETLIEAKVDVILIDTYNRHSQLVIDAVKNIKAKFKDLQLIVGDVVTKEGTLALIKAGADSIKVGFGTGSISTTRIISGVGIPQITAIYDCATVASNYNIPIISDGGIKYSGDITKAIVAGANIVMIGGLFAGCQESPGNLELFQGRKFKVYRAMHSLVVLEKSSDDMDFQSSPKKAVPEGVEGRVAFKGIVQDTIFQLIGGLRAGMGYVGASTIDDLIKDAMFIKITSASFNEGHPHNVLITNESPNYNSIEY